MRKLIKFETPLQIDKTAKKHSYLDLYHFLDSTKLFSLNTNNFHSSNSSAKDYCDKNGLLEIFPELFIDQKPLVVMNIIKTTFSTMNIWKEHQKLELDKQTSFYHFLINHKQMKYPYKKFTEKDSPWRQEFAHFQDFYDFVRLIQPEIKEEKKATLSQSRKRPQKIQQYTLAEAVETISTEILPDYLTFKEQNPTSRIGFALFIKSHNKGTNIALQSNREGRKLFQEIGGYYKLLKLIKVLNPIIDIDFNQISKHTFTVDQAVDMIVNNLWPQYKSSIKDKTLKQSFNNFCIENSLGSKIYQQAQANHHKLNREVSSWDNLKDIVRRQFPEVVFDKNSTKNSYNKQQALDTIVTEIWPDFLEYKKANPLNYYGFYYYFRAIHPKGKAIYQQATNVTCLLKRDVSNVENLLNQAIAINDDIEFTKYESIDTLSKEDAVLALVKNIFPDYLEAISIGLKSTFYNYCRSIHPLGYRIYYQASEKTGILGSKVLSFEEILKEAIKINPNIPFDKKS